MFAPVPKELDVPALEQEVLRFWEENQIERLYLERNLEAEERFSFLDGPITANGPMGVHHAWGRTYKDLWQRYNTMLGKRQRYQNGFDGQGLWVEVTVERQLGFTSKRDIEVYGVANFVRKCKENVLHYADMMTRQSRRLGYFMDWANSYYTLSDENNYAIWHFLKTCHERGLIYLGTDVMPWCTRCDTGLSEQEIAEGYQELTHQAAFVRFPLLDEPDASLLVWTTTPWTLAANVAVAIHPDITYVRVRDGEGTVYVAKGVLDALKHHAEAVEELPAGALLGRRYGGPFDELATQQGVEHAVILWEEVSEAEGTGLVHIAPGCGTDDFALGKKLDLSVIAPIDRNGFYLDGFSWLTGRNVHDVTEPILDNLRQKGLLYRSHSFTHRYPTCWRCSTEVVFRLVDEWFISMDPLRQPLMDVARTIRWLPRYGLDREIDWLRNMDDWMISKKRYFGLALPFWICPNRHLQVIGGKEELFEKALGGVQDLESPHRPWIDQVKMQCPECGEVAERIPDVGTPWLDAGIVPFSTLCYFSDRDYWREWFPAQFITESFPGQFRNWFYSLLAMSTVLENTKPFETVLGHALMRDQHGKEMHTSWGNLIPFDEAADRAGADVMRWLFCLHSPEANVTFGWESLDEVKRRLLTLWNTYGFFVTYANVDGWSPATASAQVSRSLLDRWILARLNRLILEVRSGLDQFDPMNPSRAVERFVEDLSTWYVRRSRRRFWRAERDEDKQAAYTTLYECLTVLTRLIAPFMPFLAETLYGNLVRDQVEGAPRSVHLADYPVADEASIDQRLLDAMGVAQRIVALGRAARERAGIKVRQPLARMYVKAPTAEQEQAIRELEAIILDELNVKELEPARSEDEFVDFTIRPNLPELGPRYGRRLPRIRAALEQLDPAEVARSLESGKRIGLTVDGEDLELLPGDVLVSAGEREGYAAMAGEGFLVVIDTQLDSVLIQEGLAREVVRRINDWRRAAGFAVDDRISVSYLAAPELAGAIERHHEYIRREVLASEILAGVQLDGGFHARADFSDQWLEVQLERAQM